MIPAAPKRVLIVEREKLAYRLQ